MSGRPIRNCPGVRASIPSSLSGSGIYKRSAVKAGFYLCEHRVELLESEFDIAYHSHEVRLHRFDSCLPEATEVRNMLQNELPSYVLGGEEASHSILGLLTSQEMVEFLNLTCSSNKLVPQSL